MRAKVLGVAAMAAALPFSPAGAQTAAGRSAPGATSGASDIVVTGQRSRPSGWREAETSHVELLSDGSEADLVRLARNLETLHRLLSDLLGRGNLPDDKAKLRITLIGDVASFDDMDLHNKRWQQGPFNDLFQISRYYDPRADGDVMAVTRVDQQTTIEHSPATLEVIQSALTSLAQQGPQNAGAGPGGTPIGDFATAGLIGPHDLPFGTGAKVIDVSAEGLLYAGYAQRFLLTYFPAAYPRWYLDGFGQVFSSLVVRGDNLVEFGRAPAGSTAVLQEFGSFPIAEILDDAYLTKKPGSTRWTPIHAWLLTHFLFFSDDRRPQLRRYLAARAAGADPRAAAELFGDQKQLATELRSYFRGRKPFLQVQYSARDVEEPIVRRLSQGDAAFVSGRLELGSRVVIPPAPPADAAPQIAKAMTAARGQALRERERWLVRLRADATRWSRELGAQLLLAEAECRSGNAEGCIAAATRAEALAPGDTRANAWHGMGLVERAASEPAATRGADLLAARHLIVAANHRDNDAIEPLLAYHASFTEVGEAPPVAAIDGLQKAMEAVPSAPETRLQLATALAGRGRLDQARTMVLPVAVGAYDTPERPAARALLARTAGPAASGAPAP